MGRIKKDEKKAMLMIIEYGFSFLLDDMGEDWADNDLNTVQGFKLEDLEAAKNRLMKKAGFKNQS